MIKFKDIFTFQDPYIAAASGLVSLGDSFYVVSDDELSLVKFSLNGTSEVIRIFEGTLPEEYKARKKQKPDFESLVVLPDQSILCIPSGSKPNRVRSAIVYPDKKVKELSLQNIYGELLKTFPELNIEGAVIYQEKIRLFQRGNGSLHQNAVIDLNLTDFLSDTYAHVKIIPVKIGTLNAINLSFTDASFSQGLFWFLAVAEDSESTYLDGEFAGATIGAMDLEGNIHFQEELDIRHKPEGLVVREKDIFIVTDADDRTIPSKLYSGVLS
jgi:hypothetical protein